MYDPLQSQLLIQNISPQIHDFNQYIFNVMAKAKRMRELCLKKEIEITLFSLVLNTQLVT